MTDINAVTISDRRNFRRAF